MIKIYKEYDLKNSCYSHLSSIVKYYIETDDIKVIISVIKMVDNYLFVGKMSKILFAFKNKDIVIAHYINDKLLLKNNLLIANSGVSLKALSNFCMINSIEGFEKISTIPGELGGSIKNNASFLDQGIVENLLFILAIDKDGHRKILSKNQLDISYRNVKNLNELFVYQVIFKIKKKPRFLLYFERKKAIEYRIKNQPHILSLGSTFKNYKDLKAYKIIEKFIDFREFQGVKISSSHLNFIQISPFIDYLNIVKLIERIQEVVYNKLSFYLETEIKIIY